METHYVEAPFSPDPATLLGRLHLDSDSDEAEDFLALLDRIKPLVHPRAAYLESSVEADRASGRVVIDGVVFQSRLLAGHLKDEAVAWPHVATCGREVYEYALAMPDQFERYWVDEIMAEGLSQARAEMLRHVEKKFSPGKVSTMGPGSLVEWPLEQQKPLFELLADGVAFCGIQLTDTMLMLPNKSISGILFR
ncbi:MAG: hypothetical protein LUH45_00165, partial [Clostridiales bacterium]|nr:hypothetical protein [Clostridiales bacterium]